MRRSSVARTVTVTVEFEPGEVPDRRYYSHPYRPTSVALTYTWRGNGWNHSGPKISGPRVNKGNRLSTEVTVEEYLYSWDPAPEWLPGLVSANRPAAPADLPVQPEHLPHVDLDALTGEARP